MDHYKCTSANPSSGVSGEGRGALGEDDAELPGGAPEEADQHGGPPRLKQLAGVGGRRRGWITGIRRGRRIVEPQPLDERLDFRGRLLPFHAKETLMRARTSSDRRAHV